MSESGAWGWTSELCGRVEGDMGFGMGMRTEPQAHFPATFGVGVLARVACGLSRRQRSSWRSQVGITVGLECLGQSRL